MNKKVKASISYALDFSKVLLLLLIIIISAKLYFNPSQDPINVIIYRIFIVAILLVPIIFIGSFIYSYINYDVMSKYDEEFIKNEKE